MAIARLRMRGQCRWRHSLNSIAERGEWMDLSPIVMRSRKGRERVPLNWAITQNDLAEALMRHEDTKRPCACERTQTTTKQEPV